MMTAFKKDYSTDGLLSLRDIAFFLTYVSGKKR